MTDSELEDRLAAYCPRGRAIGSALEGELMNWPVANRSNEQRSEKATMMSKRYRAYLSGWSQFSLG